MSIAELVYKASGYSNYLSCDQWNYYYTQVTGQSAPAPEDIGFTGTRRWILVDVNTWWSAMGTVILPAVVPAVEQTIVTVKSTSERAIVPTPAPPAPPVPGIPVPPTFPPGIPPGGIVDLIWSQYSMISSTIGFIVASVADWESYVIAGLAQDIQAIDAAVMNAREVVSMGVLELVKHIGNYIGDMLHVILQAGAHIYIWLRDMLHDILNSVYFKIALSIHTILTIVMPQYRAMWKKVYQAIMGLSKALGFEAGFVLLAIRNTRNLVLDTATIFGRKYDLAEVGWLSEFTKIVEQIQKKAKEYANDPEELFHDLGELIERPSADAKAGFLSGIWTILDGVVTTISDIGPKLEIVANDFNRLIADLPETIRSHIPDFMTSWHDEFSVFMRDEFWPNIRTIGDTLNVINTDVAAAKQAAIDAAAKIKSVPQTFTEIKTQTEADQLAIFNSLDELQNKQLGQRIVDYLKQYDPSLQKVQALVRQPWPTVPPPPLLTLEPAVVTIPSPGEVKPRATWFVGDF